MPGTIDDRTKAAALNLPMATPIVSAASSLSRMARSAAAETGFADDQRDDHAYPGEREHDQVKGLDARSAEKHAPRHGKRGLDIDDDVLDQFGQTECQDHEIGTAHAQARIADKRCKSGGGHAGKRHDDPDRQHQPGQRRDVGADPDEDHMPQRYIAGHSGDHDPALGQREPDQKREADADKIAVGDERQRNREQCTAVTALAARPMRGVMFGFFRRQTSLAGATEEPR